MTEGLRLDGVTIIRAGTRAGDHPALFPPLTLCVPPGAILTVMGPSGSGKSSLLAALCGTLGSSAPDEAGWSPHTGSLLMHGAVWLNGRRIDGLPVHQRGCGLLFQDPLLFPHMSVAENLDFALPRHIPRRERPGRIAQALEECRLPGFGPRAPHSLSGGQQARIALMRALLAEPEALLLDEPFASLDAALRQDMRQLVADQVRHRTIPALLVTHDPADIIDGSRVLSL